MTIKTLLVPVDFSPHAAKAIETAIEFAKAFGAEIILLHAYSFPMGVATPYDYRIPANILGQARESAVKRLEADVDKISAAGVQARGMVVDRVPSQAILETAEEVGADLIVMGTRGLTGLKHVALGSVADRTIRRASCPVLTVHDPAH